MRTNLGPEFSTWKLILPSTLICEKCGRTKNKSLNEKVVNSNCPCTRHGIFSIGQKIGKWTVIDDRVFIKAEGYKDPDPKILVRCDCGKERYIYARILDKALRENNILIGCQYCLRLRRRFADNPAWKGYKNIPRRYFNGIKKSAFKRGLEFNLTIEYIGDLFEQQNGRCALTGNEIWFSEARKYKIENSASLDRINNNLGYLIGNVQFISKKVNFAKHKSSMSEFIDMCQQITIRFNEGKIKW